MKKARKVRGPVALLLAAVLLYGSSVPGRAAETIETVKADISVTEPEDTTMPLETTIPVETAEGTDFTESTEQTESNDVTGPSETEEMVQSVYHKLLEQMTALQEEGRQLSPEKEVLDEFVRKLRQLWDKTYDSYDQSLITESELETLDQLGWEILSYLETEYRYVDGAIMPLDVQRYGSQELPMQVTSANSVASLGNGSGIKFRIFNYTNGKDAGGNYIVSGGVNDNGLSGYFDFRGTSYENTGADGKAVSSVTNPITDIDGYTANHATVLPNLGSDGYPVFDGSRDGGPQKSLGYLFGAGGKGVTGYAPANTPLRQNSRGQYYYNSADNAVDFDTASNRFIVRNYKERGKTTATQGTGQYYDFFPFTYWNGTTMEDAGTVNWYNYQNTAEVDYWYGMTMEATFSMPAAGMVNQDQMVFEFSGDDDVWVFIDGVLVLDLGGTHGVVSGSINFATGQVQQYLDWGGANEASTGTSYPTTLKARFDTAGKVPNGGWNGNVFADYTEHTIKFYYLERATSCANCKILFNMPILPTGKLTVEKQVEGILTRVTEAEEYTFTLVQKMDDAQIPASSVPYDRIDADTGAVLETCVTDEGGNFKIKAGQRAEFDLTAGKTYLVRESDTGQYAEIKDCTVSGVPQPVPSETGEITMDPDSPVQVVFTNRLNTTAFSVEKWVAGNMGDRDLEFHFRARLYTGDPGNGGTFMSFPEPETGDGYILEEGEARFRLKHGNVMQLDDVPIGAWVVLTEEYETDYTTVWRQGDKAGESRTAKVGPLTVPEQITYTNTREVLIGTGITLETVPYMMMTAAGTLPLLRRRRKKE